MLRNLLLGGTSPLVYRPENEDGAGDEPADQTDQAGANVNAGGDQNVNADAEAAAAAAAEAAKPKPAPQKDWRDREIARKHAKLKEIEETSARNNVRLSEIEAENQRLREMVEAANRRAPPADGTPTGQQEPAPRRTETRPAPVPVGSDDERIRSEAARLVAQQTAEQQMDAAVEKGKTAYGDKWAASLENLRTLGGFDADTLVGILATDDPAKVLFELGRDPGDGNEPAYLRVMGLPPAKRLNELAKMAMPAPAAAAKKVISDAAAPVEPINQGGSASREKPFDIYDQKLTTADLEQGRSAFEKMKPDTDANDEKWFEARRAQKMASKNRPWSPKA